MSVAIQIQDGVTPELNEVARRVSGERVAAEVGPRLTRLMARHFVRNGTNRHGWPTTNFWARAAKATSYQVSGSAVDIICNQVGVRQRYYGGTIRPVNAGALTIPMTGKAYGKLASDFPGLFLMVTKKGAFLARYTDRTRTTNKGQTRAVKQKSTLEVLFRLAASVTQSPNPNVIPDDAAFGRELDLAVAALLRRQ